MIVVRTEYQIPTKEFYKIRWQDLGVLPPPTPEPEEAEVVIDWIPNLIEEIICNWHYPRVERWYIFSDERLAIRRQLAPGEFAFIASITIICSPSRNSLTGTN